MSDDPSQALVASRLKIPSKVDVQGENGRSTADRQLNDKRLCERLLFEKCTVNFRHRPFRALLSILSSSTAQFCAPVNFQKKTLWSLWSKSIGPSTLEPTSLLLLTDRPLLLWPVRYQGSSKKAFNQISHYESLITNFLTYDEDKKRIQNQVESIQNLAKKIFRNMNFNQVRSEIVQIILPPNDRENECIGYFCG